MHCFEQFELLTNKKIPLMVFVRAYVFLYLEGIPKRGVAVLILRETAKQMFQVIVPFYTPINNV